MKTKKLKQQQGLKKETRGSRQVHCVVKCFFKISNIIDLLMILLMKTFISDKEDRKYIKGFCEDLPLFLKLCCLVFVLFTLISFFNGFLNN